MRNKEKFLEIIYKCAEELNKQLSEEEKITLEESTTLIGENSSLDSLGIVILMISVEEHIANTGISVNIMDVLTESDEPPFETIGEMSLWLLEQSS
jgi:acyl carrier protein